MPYAHFKQPLHKQEESPCLVKREVEPFTILWQGVFSPAMKVCYPASPAPLSKSVKLL